MANKIRIKRRLTGGGAGAPASMANAELAFNEQSKILYYGLGGDEFGTGTNALAIAGEGAFTPVAHVGSGGTQHADVIAAGASGFMSGTDKTKLNGIATGANAYTHPNHSGHVTSTGDGATAIATGVVSNAHLVTVATQTFKARTSAGTGAPEDLTVAQALTLLGVSSGAAALTSAATTALGVSAVGVATVASRGDHVHAMPTLNALNLPVGAVAMNNQRITGLATPIASTDAATMGYVDTIAQGLDPKGSVRVVTTAAGTLATSFANGQVIDGVTLATGNRILIKNQAAPAENGIYTVNATGVPTRALDANTWAKFPAAYVFAEEGTVNNDMGFVCTVSASGTLGTTGITFQQFSGAGQISAGTGLAKNGNTLSLGTATAGVLGGVMVGTNLSIAAGVLSANAVNLAEGTKTTTTVPITSSTGTGATLSAATTGLAGVMTAADKTKLDGIATSATNYTHPANHPPAIITQDASNRFVTDAEKSTWSAKANTAAPTFTGLVTINKSGAVTTLNDSAAALHICGMDSNSNRIVFDCYSTAAETANLAFRKAEGTSVAPTALSVDSCSGTMSFQGYSSSLAYRVVASISCLSNEALTDATAGTRMEFRVRGNGESASTSINTVTRMALHGNKLTPTVDNYMALGEVAKRWASLYCAIVVATTVGPSTSQQHTLPAVTSGTVVIDTATQTLSNKTLVAPALGTPASGNLANCAFPTLNQNSTGTASNITGIASIACGGLGVSTSGYLDGSILKKSGTSYVAATAGTDFLNNASTLDGGTF